MKILGKPIQPTLVFFPISFLGTAVFFDALYLALDLPIVATISFCLIFSGIVGALVTSIVAWLEAKGLKGNSKAISLWPTLGSAAIILLFTLSLLLRDWSSAPTAAAQTFSYLGGIILLLSTWERSDLIFNFGVAGDLRSIEDQSPARPKE